MSFLNIPQNSIFSKKKEEENNPVQIPWKSTTPAASTPLTTSVAPKTSYQQNVSQPVETKWYSGDQPTVREAMGYTMQTMRTDKQRGYDMQAYLQENMLNSASPFYMPYSQPTNQAISRLNDLGLGIDTSNIDEQWFNDTAELNNFLHFDGQTNAPSKPGKKASIYEQAAWERYQIGLAYETTNKAKTEWAALQDEINFLANDTFRNYSDDQIIKKIYGEDGEKLKKKYPTLAAMDASLQPNGKLLELNSVIGYSKDAVYGAIWAARNDGGTGSPWRDMAMSYLGEGNVWQENPEITERLNPQSDRYAPYTVGSTMEDVCMYYNRPQGFDRKWLEENKPDGSDKTEKDMWNRSWEANKFTDVAEQQLAKFNERLDKKLESAEDPAEVMKWVNNRLDEEGYDHLKKLNDSLDLVDSLVDTSRTIDFSMADIQRKVEERCAANSSRQTGTQTLQANGAPLTVTAQETETEKAETKMVSQAPDQLEGTLTATEENAFLNTPSTWFGKVVDGFVEIGKNPLAMLTKNEATATEGYSTRMVPIMDEVAKNQQAQTQLNAVNAELASYQDRVATIEGMEGVDLRQFVNLTAWANSEDGFGFINSYRDLLEHPTAAMKDPELSGLLDQALLGLYQMANAAENPDVYGITELTPEMRDQALQLWEAYKNSDGMDFTAEEADRYERLMAAKSELDATIEETNPALEKAAREEEMWDLRIGLYDALGMDSTGLKTARTIAETLPFFANYEASKWNAYNAYDLMMRSEEGGASFEEVKEAAEQGNAQIQDELDSAMFVREYCEENGIELPENYMKNLDRYIAKLERQRTDYDFFVLQGEPDFDEYAANGREIDSQLAMSQRLETWDSEGFSYSAMMTDTEKDTYYYLLGKYGAENPAAGFAEAQKFWAHLNDPEYGVISTRGAEAVKEAARQLTGDNVALANALAILSAPVEGMLGIGYMALYGLTGMEYNPNSALLNFGKFSQTVNEETSRRIQETLPEGPKRDLAMGMYEILYNRGRSMANSFMLGAPEIGGRLGAILTEVVGAFPMAAGAASLAIADAKEKGADDGTAFNIGAVTLAMEDFTEGLTRSNIMQAFSGTGDDAAGFVMDQMVEWLTKSGFEEAFGETLTDYVENYVNENWLGVNSDHQARVDQYISENGLNPDNPVDVEEAEKAAREEEIAGLLHTALISYLSPGTDVVLASAKEGINDFHNIRVATRNLQKQGIDTSMKDVRKEYYDWKRRSFNEQNTTASEQTETPAEQATQEEQATTAQTEAEERFPTEGAEEELPFTRAGETAVQTETAEERANANEQVSNLARDIGQLDAVVDSDPSTQAAAVAALLGYDKMLAGNAMGNAINAAASNITNVFGTMRESIESMKNLMLGAQAAGVSINNVKQAVISAALSESSEAARVAQSEEFKSAAPQEQAQMLAGTVEADQSNETVAQETERTTHETMIAKEMGKLISGGALNSVTQAQAAAEKAQDTLDQANKSLQSFQGVLEAKTQALNAAIQNLVNDVTADSQHMVDGLLNEVVRAQTVVQEYEQAQQKAQQAHEEAQANLKTTRETAVKELRVQAEAAVQEQNRQAAEREAQLAEQQRIAEEQAAQAQAEEDQRSGKKAEMDTQALAENWADTMQLEGDDRDAFIERVQNRQEERTLGTIDMTGKLSNAEGYLSISAFSRKTGLQFQLSDALPAGSRGMYQNGTVYLNSNMVRSGEMTVGQALIEASLHEITHSMEQTKSYKNYRNIVLRALFNGDNASYQAAIDQKIADYKNSVNQDLTPEQAENEIIADFARTRLNEKDVVERFMDAGMGGKMRNILHNINQALKNFRLKGEERATAEYLRKAERAFQKAIDEVAKTAVHPEGNQFSVVQFAQAAGMTVDENTLQLYDANGEEIDGVTEGHKVTPDMIDGTPVGMLIDLAQNGANAKNGNVKFAATISPETAQAQKQMFADLMNMVARYKDSNLVWEIASSTLFSAMKSNSDPQYSTTVDFGTVCAKTQEIINVMSQVMLEKGRGLTREEVLKVYNETANAGLTVPCPVCYVFSRWMGVPSLLNQMSQYQKKFVKLNEDGSINIEATQEEANAYINAALEKYGDKEGIDKAKVSITNRMKTQEKNRTNALTVLNSETATAEEKAAAQQKHDEAIKTLDSLQIDLGEVEAYNWVTQALCLQQRKGKTTYNVLDKNGNYVIDPNFEITPDDVLFDLRRTGDFAKYTKNWTYRNTRGAGMGKAIMPYSGETIGDIVFGTERKADIQNPFLTQVASKAADGVKNAVARARQQNLIGGQRLQSTSDFRPEWGLDYMMSFLELQAVGSKVQMYTKVAEAVDLLASMGADINLSIMGSGNGYHEATPEEIALSKKNTKEAKELRSRMGEVDGTIYVLDFSDVTGMDYNTAKALKNKYSNVQAILVGMNDIHVRLAMANPDIDFIIPWHSSGNSKDVLSSMISSVGEKLETSSDYTDTQSDHENENRTKEQQKLWDLRMKILQGKKISADERDTIYHDPYLKPLYDRFNVEGVDADCYKVKLGKDQAKQIFPYEYWDKTSTKANANENGQRFIEYCEHFGVIPRFSGVVKKNDDGTFSVTGNFAGAIYDDNGNITGYDPSQMADGYWKVLIDRPMYDNDGNYRDQQIVDVTKARIGSLDENGQLVDSDMPLKTSAMYGPNYSEQEKTAVDNTLAALDEQAMLNGGQYSVFGDVTDADIDQALAQAEGQYSAEGHLTDADIDQRLADAGVIPRATAQSQNVEQVIGSLGLTTEQDGASEFVLDENGNEIGRLIQTDRNGENLHGIEFFSKKDAEKYGKSFENAGYVREENAYILGIQETTKDQNASIPPTGTGTYNLNPVEPGPNVGMRQFGIGMGQQRNVLHEDVRAWLRLNDAYVKDSNNEQLDRAISWIAGHATQTDQSGFYSAMREAESPEFNPMSADGQARMIAMMGMAATIPNENESIEAQKRLANLFNIQGTNAGQTLQARKMFRLMTPAGRQAVLLKLQDQINNDFAKKGNNKRVELSDWVLKAAAEAKNEEDFQKVRQAAAKELAEQMPANWREKFQSLRMLSMLANPRTHIRNILGNAIFMPAVGLKNKIGAGLEAAFIRNSDRTKTMGLASAEARAFAKADAKEMESVLRGESKYSEGTAVQRERKIFKSKLIQGAVDVNSMFLEGEDWIFLGRHYRNALAGYMTANKLTAADMKGNTLDNARAYAINEAQKATYRDANEIATWLNNVKNPAARFIVNAVLPFKKTPANILRRGIEYSPVNLVKALTTDAKHLKQWQAFQNGELSVLPEKAISPAQYIDRLSSGLSGTLILALGALLSKLGFVKAGLDDDEDEFDKMNGSQEYSLEIGGVSFTIDWAAPVCMPFFVGATIMEEIQNAADNNGEGFSFGHVMDSILGITEPVFNLSMLDGVNTLLTTSQYADGNKITQIGEKIITNYFTSYVPSILGAAARTIDTTRRKNYVESGADLSVFRSAIEQVENKIPFLSRTNIPYRDVWGNADESPQGWAAIENFISPGYGNALKDDPVNNELKRIYEETKDPNMIPKTASKTVSIGRESVRLNAEQYDQYVVDRGQTAYNSIKALMESPVWQICDDDTRGMMIADAWTYANQIARHNLDPKGKKDSWVANAEHNGNFVDTVIDRAAEANRKDYIAGYGQNLAEALETRDNETCNLCMAALESADATDAEIRSPIRDYFKPLYQQAFEAGDENTMEEIMDILIDLDVGFKEKDIKSWIPSEEEEEDEEETDNTRWLNMNRP